MCIFLGEGSFFSVVFPQEHDKQESSALIPHPTPPAGSAAALGIGTIDEIRSRAPVVDVGCVGAGTAVSRGAVSI